MKLVKGKSCQKCGSKNVYLDYDLGHWYEHCLICGYTCQMEILKPGKGSEASWPGDVSIEA